MLVPNAKPGSIFFVLSVDSVHFFNSCRLYGPFNVRHPAYGTILHGVELFLITVSYNDYGMLENMTHFYTQYTAQDLIEVFHVTR